MPISDQDGDGLCYAYTAAQMVDYHHLKKNPDHPLTSVHWLAFSHKYRNHHRMARFFNRLTSPRRWLAIREPGQLGYSDINLALKDFEDSGVCSEAVIKSKIAKFKKTDKLNDDEFLFLFNLFHQRVQEERKADAEFDDRLVLRLFQEAMDDLIMQRKKDITDPYGGSGPKEIDNFRDLRISELEGLNACVAGKEPQGEGLELFLSLKGAFQFDRKTKQLEILKDQIFGDCLAEGGTEKIKLPPVKHIGEFWASNEKILGAIDDALDRDGGQPAALGYCSKVMRAEDFKPPVDLSVVGLTPRVAKMGKHASDCGPHYSLVVGRRQHQGSCQYMIRNTYGPHFWSNNKNLECTCEDKNNKQFSCNYEQDGGKDLVVLGCWVPGDQLAKSTFNVTSFK
jgi:hypothetical protein